MREILLPQYLAKNPVWRDLCYGIDSLMAGVDEGAIRLRYLRYPYAAFKTKGSTTQTTLNDGVATSLHAQDKQALMKQVTYVGAPFSDTTNISTTQGLMMLRHASSYWYKKGTGENFSNFLNYILGLQGALTMTPLWTKDYKVFVDEATVAAVDKIQNGGAFYPTTHVSLDISAAANSAGGLNMPLPKFIQLFNDLSNYTLILHKVSMDLIDSRPVLDSTTLELPGLAFNVVQEDTWVF